MKGTSVPTGLGLRHDGFVAARLEDRLYEVTVVLRTRAFDGPDAHEMLTDMIDHYNSYRHSGDDDDEGPAVVVRRITVAEVTPETTESGGR